MRIFPFKQHRVNLIFSTTYIFDRSTVSLHSHIKRYENTKHHSRSKVSQKCKLRRHPGQPSKMRLRPTPSKMRPTPFFVEFWFHNSLWLGAEYVRSSIVAFLMAWQDWCHVVRNVWVVTKKVIWWSVEGVQLQGEGVGGGWG